MTSRSLQRRIEDFFPFDPWIAFAPVGAIVLGGVAYGLTRWAIGGGDALPAGVVEPMQFRGVPFASGIRGPLWPVVTRSSHGKLVSYRDVNGEYHGNWSRRFGAPRDNGARYHAGMDIYANYGDPVVAMGDGVVTAVQSFHLGSWAMFVDHGDVVVMYGEIEPKSWRQFGVQVGSRVSKGQPLARIACMRWDGSLCDSHMLHLETYVSGTTRNRAWYQDRSAPAQLLDPTRLLLRAQG